MKERIGLFDLNSMKEHYQSLLRELKAISSTSNESDEILRNIFTSKGLKIFLIGDIQNERILVQVEVFPTAYTSPENFEYTFCERQSEIKHPLRSLLEHQISNLFYLRTLNDKGFTLSLVGEECIWYATKVLETEPPEELFELLNPLVKWASLKF